MTKIFAHRGASKVAPENTMAAFKLAYEMHAEGIETDVQLTKDQVPVLIHDENVRRTTNGTGFVQDYTLEELKQLDAGSWFSDKYEGETIPTLDEFLTWVQDKPLDLNIELKNNVIDYKDLESIVYDRLVAFDLIPRTVISSFSSESIKRFKDISSDLATAWLTSSKIRFMIPFTKSLGANRLHIKYTLLNKRIVKKCHANDFEVAVYTINRPSQMNRCFKLGCDTIFTDVPDIALQERNNN
ncbi:glycerophosphodiester phosphodiesterase [Radiobacillus kanasensis]|uniref:glycerophosphodiester phosphodiesterase n=1 Tax=Radiobacillus kanasensis TaxID=2844358 RepID=UPI001E44AF58|nr:glycerophosphodiester phosphodiesterase [Radiobacillus kanasensis]UFT97700.1 glycerophosphodiester phosphodiesterase [Radiobacillus kanasensis]